MQLFEEDTAADLVCRGYSRDLIQQMIGVDVGYNGSKMSAETKGVDRVLYKVEHVCQRLGDSDVEAALELYSRRASKTEVLSRLGLHGENIVKLKRLFSELGFAEQFKQADRAQRKASMRSGMEQRYGTDNPFKLDQFQKQAEQTRQEKYGAKYTLAAGSALEAQARQRFRDQLSDDDFRSALAQKKAATNLARLGVRAPAQHESVKVKIAEAHQSRYGSHYSQTDQARAAQSQRALADGKEWAEKARQTNLLKHGVEYVAQLPAQRQRQSEVMRADGVRRAEQAKLTNLQKYGYEHSSQVSEIRLRKSEIFAREGHQWVQKARAANLEKYGVPSWTATEEGRAAQSARMLEEGLERAQTAKQTNLERFGAPTWSSSQQGRARLSEILSSEPVRARVRRTKKVNGTSSSSASEEALHQALVEVFGESDVVRQYADQRYPWSCDFYIPSRDLFIELNGTWTHGYHWFNARSAADQHQLARWQQREDSAYFRNAETIWTVSDVKKRAAAAEHQLNYVVFWDGAKLLDAKLWLAMGAPDGTDWQAEYSWIPDRDLSIDQTPPELQPTPRRARQAARAFNGERFYCRELQLWADQQPAKWGTVKGFLHSNRFEHMGRERGAGKLPDEISDFELVRGMGIAGMVRAYSTFDISVMLQVIEQHSPTKIYDPCAGWGERLFTAAAVGVEYQGVDINEAVVAGHQRMIEHYGLTQQSSAHGDAADVHSTDHDMVFTCPPYGDIEIYTDHGAENLDEEGFLSWWAQVVASSTAEPTKVFAYQINQKWRDRMNQVLLDAGWRLEEQIALGHQSSHFTRKSGASIKKEFEEVQVFVR